MKPIAAHAWDREEHEHYVEPEWCSRRLFEVERFGGIIFDPCCGFGRIPDSSRNAGLVVAGSDVVNRGYTGPFFTQDFLQSELIYQNIVCNPPFDLFEKFVNHALRHTIEKVAMLWLVRRLPAARWLKDTPLVRIWWLTPRPSIPPGHTITAGHKPGGGTQDFCWLVWDHGHKGGATADWLQRDALP
jgi:hypothetical protein